VDGSLAVEKIMGWDWITLIALLGLLGIYMLFSYCVLLKRQTDQQAGKLISYQKLGVLVQDYLRAREYTEKGRMGEAGKIYESVLRQAMSETLEEIHGNPNESAKTIGA
jgi:hypothetical protein